MSPVDHICAITIVDEEINDNARKALGGRPLDWDWRKESEMFDETAEYYDQFRPSYPGEIIDTILSTTRVNADSRLLEIGSGSGKATQLFAAYSLSIDCIDPGEKLVKMGRAKFSGCQNINFDVGRFEEAELRPQYYHLIYSAQAFHWIPQPVGYEKCAYTLKDDGYIALFWNMYIILNSSMDNELVQISQKHGGFADFLTTDECEKRISSVSAEIVESGFFDSPSIHRVLWNQQYSAEEYYGFVQTGNRFVQKPADEKLEAYEDIRRLANRHGGKINRPYLCTLYLARRRSWDS